MRTTELLKTIELCKKGKSKSQFRLYKYCYEQFFPICRRYLKDEDRAMETMNIAFHKVLNNIKKYDINKAFNPWVARIMVTTSIDEYRKDKAQRIVQITEVTKSYTSDNDIDTFIEEDNILNLLNHLPSMGRQVFNLYAIDGYKHREIAELLDISESTSKWHVTQSRLKLQKLLKNNNALQPVANF